MPQLKTPIPHKIKIELTVKLDHYFETLIKLLFHLAWKGLPMTKLRLASSLNVKKERLLEVNIDHDGEKQQQKVIAGQQIKTSFICCSSRKFEFGQK